MALEAVIFQQGLFGYGGKESSNLVGGNWGRDFVGLQDLEEEIRHGSWDSPPLDPSMLHSRFPSPSPDPHNGFSPGGESLPRSKQRRRRRVRCRKNREEIESQRMTHIAVERNRRKQMNEYLSALRSLMPDSYVQRGDQASVIGGAINFVKELEHRLQYLGTHSETNKGDCPDGGGGGDPDDSRPFSEFFAFPQYSTSGPAAAAADVEVTVVESHASIKIRTKRRPRQLLSVVSGLQTLRLTILHLNVTTVDQIVLYSLGAKVEDECRLNSVDEVATAVHQMVGRIQEEGPILNV